MINYNIFYQWFNNNFETVSLSLELQIYKGRNGRWNAALVKLTTVFSACARAKYT